VTTRRSSAGFGSLRSLGRIEKAPRTVHFLLEVAVTDGLGHDEVDLASEQALHGGLEVLAIGEPGTEILVRGKLDEEIHVAAGLIEGSVDRGAVHFQSRDAERATECPKGISIVFNQRNHGRSRLPIRV